MGTPKFRTGAIQRITEDAIARRPPQSVEDCCAIAAQVAVLVNDGPWTDEFVINSAAALAEGLFDEAFLATDYGQRTYWIDECERALRAAIV